MSLHAANLSPSALQAINARLADPSGGLSRAGREMALAAGASAEPDLAVAAPHDVYNLPLSALVEQTKPDAAEQVGLRCLVTSGGKPIATVELPEPDGKQGVVTTHGPFTEETANAVHAVEDSSEVADGEYELRLLRVPALYLMALWLKDQQDEHDIFVPLEPAPSELEAGARYSWDELQGKLREPARTRIAAEEQEHPGREATS